VEPARIQHHAQQPHSHLLHVRTGYRTGMDFNPTVISSASYNFGALFNGAGTAIASSS